MAEISKIDGTRGFFRGAGALMAREVPFYVAGMVRQPCCLPAASSTPSPFECTVPGHMRSLLAQSGPHAESLQKCFQQLLVVSALHAGALCARSS